MWHVLRAVILSTVLLYLPACGAQYSISRVTVADFPYRYGGFDYKVAWKTTKTDKGVNLDGIMKDVRYAYMDGSQVTVWLMDRDKRILARATDFPFPQQLKRGDVSAFSLKFNNGTLQQGDVLEFLIHYQGEEGKDGIDWRSGFRADALTGAIIREENKGPDDW